ncbi:MAG: hypothetical protein MRQ09_01735 [Candidatus Midichloria sp.]|nr:hypothetical protein [Candidatus Midichloria sp.]
MKRGIKLTLKFTQVSSEKNLQMISLLIADTRKNAIHCTEKILHCLSFKNKKALNNDFMKTFLMRRPPVIVKPHKEYNMVGLTLIKAELDVNTVKEPMRTINAVENSTKLLGFCFVIKKFIIVANNVVTTMPAVA